MGCPHDNIWDHCFTVWQVVTSWEVWADKASKLDSTLQMLEVEAMTIFASTLQEKTEKLTTHAEDTKECWQHCSMPWYGTNFSENSFLFEGSILGLRSWRSLGTRFSGAKIFQHGSDSSFVQSSSNISAVGPVLGQPLCHQRGGVTTHSPLPWPKIAECLEMLSEISAEISSDISRGFQPAFSRWSLAPLKGWTPDGSLCQFHLAPKHVTCYSNGLLFLFFVSLVKNVYWLHMLLIRRKIDKLI